MELQINLKVRSRGSVSQFTPALLEASAEDAPGGNKLCIQLNSG